ncbi:MAG: hypothetical protein ACRDL6_05880 [Solirubrobacterales bacterium]
MAEPIEFQPSDDSMMIWDGRILEIFAGSVSSRFHARGISDIEVTEGWGKSIMVKNRFGTDVGIGYDKEKLPEVREFVDRVLAKVQAAG